jgi:hypothetical protein
MYVVFRLFPAFNCETILFGVWTGDIRLSDVWLKNPFAFSFYQFFWLLSHIHFIHRHVRNLSSTLPFSRTSCMYNIHIYIVSLIYSRWSSAVNQFRLVDLHLNLNPKPSLFFCDVKCEPNSRSLASQFGNILKQLPWQSIIHQSLSKIYKSATITRWIWCEL